jgi:Ferredoxin subunits of nitrite reductase and ring-hydroxylating dioxygenases
MPKFIQVAKVSEIPNQSAKYVEVEDKRIALFNLGGEFYVIDDTCIHKVEP